ncbi:MAG: metallophosphoesterase [Oscillospiraceae bacterium]|nr:metallophosphoesterase [Oscillospiraceae bacterium]
MKILLCLVLIIFVFLIYVWVENKMLIVRKYKISLNKNSVENFRIVHISDLHKKKYPQNWNRLYSKIKSLSPDFIIISGDLVSRSQTKFEYTGKLIEILCSICPVFYAKGNHELDLSYENMSKLREIVIKNGAVFLENQKAQFEKNGILLNIYGTDLKKSVYTNKDGGYSNLEEYHANELHESFGKSESPSLLIAHNPFFFSEYSKWGADITFSGHVHAGIVNTPFGGILSPERKFFPKYTKGIYEKNGNKMIVSAGIGKLRIFNPSEILYLELEI